MRQWIRLTVALALTAVFTGAIAAEKAQGESGETAKSTANSKAVPLYKPSSSSPRAMNILSPGYGGSRQAPNAIPLGTIAPDFTLERAGGGRVSLAQSLSTGPAAIIFYRGHW